MSCNLQIVGISEFAIEKQPSGMMDVMSTTKKILFEVY